MIELDPRYKVNGDIQTLFEELVPRLPTPLARELQRVEEESRPEVRLSELCLSLIPMTFQYLALVLSGEYLASRADPDYDVVDHLCDMMRRPQVGKWDDFIRQSTRYLDSVQPQVLPLKAIENLHFLLLSDKRPRARVFDEEPKGKRLDYAEALANLRNRYVHDHDVMRDSAAETYTDYLLLYRVFLIHLRSVFDTVPLIWDQDKQVLVSIGHRSAGASLARPDDATASIVLWNPSSKTHIRLFPLLLLISEDGSSEEAFLREVKGRNLLYPYKERLIRRAGYEFEELMATIVARTPKSIPLTEKELTATLLGAQIDRLTKRTLSDYKDSLKYIPEIFLKREAIENQLDEWVESESSKPGCILLGDPGVGKTSLVGHWCEHQQKDAGNHVFLMDASKLENTNVRSIIESRLKFSSELTLSDCLETIKKQLRSGHDGGPAKRFIIIFEAVNEYNEKNMGDNRFLLWRDINSLIGTLEGYRPYFKCLITTRSDLWKVDFPSRDILKEKLNQELYHAPECVTPMDFPCLYLGPLDDIEAERIYEDSRFKKQGMSPRTAYCALSKETKRMIRNPFSLRLLLQAFHHKDVPPLTIGKLSRRFAQERALQEDAQRTILLRLLERIGELRETEITLEELLSDHARKRDPIKKRKFSWRKKPGENKVQPQSLEEIVFDDKFDGPYKRLLEDGIISERSVGEGKSAEVLLSFAQEKITDIMYTEFQRRDLKRVLRRNNIKFILLAVLTGVICSFLIVLKVLTPRMVFQFLSNSGLTSGEIGNLAHMASAANTAVANKLTLAFALFMVIAAFFITLPDILSVRTRFMLVRRFKGDLFARFLRERLTQQAGKYQKYFFLPAYLYACFLLVRAVESILGNSLAESIMNPVVDGVVPILLMLFALILLLRVFVIFRFATQPEAVYTFFGYQAAKFDFLRQVPDVLVFALMLLLLPPTLEMLNLRGDSHLMHLHNELVESPEYGRLQLNDRDVARQFGKSILLINPVQDSTVLDLMAYLPPSIVRLRNGLLMPLVVGYPLFFVLEWVFAFPLARLARYRLARKSILPP